MSVLTDYCAKVRRWIDDEDPDDATVTEWIRDGEERLNNELRVSELLVRDYATFDDDCAQLPLNWVEFEYVRLKGGLPLDFITNHDYWELKRTPLYGPQPDPTGGEVWSNRKQHYTTIGNTLFVWPPIDPNNLTQIEICYYRKVVPLGDTSDPAMERYPSIFRNCVLSASAPYLMEDERLQVWASLATAGIAKANDAAKIGRFSGSPIAPKIRGFG
jgi:hypothetical protein